ncbi:methionine ABC transporter ATP-binding protein [Clostridium tyrobutyricum]|uniref:methionine ABC transporter ATP-binding protein n=1 Tax=Clostridium tyrobutyricum TaxID=1519 RepID=UPI000311229F|nr:methionine ABC transporter ATP-binding protein [Clostridium tyrobutyricum]
MIEINNLQKFYGKNKVLKNIDLNIKDGQIYGLIGRSGAGKSTLLRCINGLEKYDCGSLKVDNYEVKYHSDSELRKFRRNIGMIFQHFSLMERKNVYDNIAIPMKFWKYSRADIDKKVKELLKIINMEDKINSKPRELSGGQKQRVAIARALSLNPKILLCDEATSALDPKTTKSILSLLRNINDLFGITVVVVTHQMSVVRQLCHEVAILENGQITQKGQVSNIFLNESQSLKNLMGEDYSESMPEKGINIKINCAENDRILSDMVKKFNMDFSIVRAKLEKYRDCVLGYIIINVDDKYEKKIIEYLSSINVKWSVVENG